MYKRYLSRGDWRIELDSYGDEEDHDYGFFQHLPRAPVIGPVRAIYPSYGKVYHFTIGQCIHCAKLEDVAASNAEQAWDTMESLYPNQVISLIVFND